MNTYKSFSDCSIDMNFDAMHTLKVCIATPDYLFFVKNMGIGTSFYHTAQMLVSHKFDVTILYCNLLDNLTPYEIDNANTRITESGVKLSYLFDESFKSKDLNQYFPSDLETVSSYLAYNFLKNENFDIIIFPDWRGLGFYTLQAKQLRLAFKNTSIWVQAHSTCLWHGLNNEQCDYTEHNIRIFYLERKSVELADLVVSPTNYLLNWMEKHGFALPKYTFVQPCLLTGTFEKTPTNKKVTTVKELIFFGRLEKRKGLMLFIQALQIVHGEYFQHSKPPITITFLGKITEIEGLSSYDYITKELKGTNFTLQFLTSFNSVQAVSYLKKEGRVAIIPSIADNSPFTVLECIYNEIPFIASDAGGIPEIVNVDDHEHALFTPTPLNLADKLITTIQNGAISSFPAVLQNDKNTHDWIKALYWSASVHASNGTTDQQTLSCLVSVFITHLDKPQHLSITLEGLTKQTYKHFEVIIVDQGSTSIESINLLNSLESRNYPFPLKIIKQKNKYDYITKNAALKLAQGEYVIFMKDDNYPKSDQIETFCSCIMHSGCDALSCVASIFQEDEDPRQISTVSNQYIPIGSGLAPNILGNYYGDANGIFRKDTLLAISVLTDEGSIPWDGYELFSRIELSGGKTSVVPEPLLLLRSTNNTSFCKIHNVSNYYRALQPMLSSFPWATFGDAILISIGQQLKHIRPTIDNDPRSIASKNLINYSEHSILSLRWLTRRMSEVGDHRGVAVTLLDHYRAAPIFDFCLLEFVSYFLKYMGSLGEAKKLCTNKEEVEFINSFGSILLKRDLKELISFVSVCMNDSVDRKILLAKLLIMDGSLLEGLRMSCSAFFEIDNTYLQRNPDVIPLLPAQRDIYLNNCQFRSGAWHWLLQGRNEGRVLDYCAPVIFPITSYNDEILLDYQQRIENVLNNSLADRGKVYSQLIIEALENNSPIVFSDLATVILRDMNLSYLEEYPDAKHSSAAEFSCRGIKHYLQFGKDEGRHSLLTYLEMNYRDVFYNYCSQVSSRITNAL